LIGGFQSQMRAKNSKDSIRHFHRDGVLVCGVLVMAMPLRSAIFEMQNEDVIVGDMSAPLTITLVLGGEIKVPPEAIMTIEGERMAFMDGTVLMGRIAQETLAVKTRFGVVQLPVTQIKTLRSGKDVTAVAPTSGTVIELQSGEMVVGEFSEPLLLELAFGGTLAVPPKELITFGEGRFTFQDGSMLKGRVTQATLTITTRFGKLSVPSTALKTIRLAQAGITPQTTGEKAQEVASGKTPTTSPPTGKTWRNSIGMDFVLIPAGTFLMGSNDGSNDEKPVHEVRLSKSFYLGKYEVTQGQWQAIMGTNPSNFKGDANLPVENVSWNEMQEFIRKLNAKEGDTKYRLPTEAEWEYAARAGTTTAYSFGNDERQLGEYAWYSPNSGNKTHPVGQKKPNAWGLYDMHGNVWEWVQDWYGPYTAGSAVDPAGPASGSFRVHRGGGWTLVAWFCRPAYRNNGAPGGRGSHLGFRLLRTAE
jgi:formylglycine-generating enzyme required for sulfatase activity